MAGKRVTIRDVARAAGVSYQTVSRAFNDKGEINGDTKRRVMESARELGYRPSRFARGLVRQDTTSIGLVIPDLLNPFFTEVAAAALDAARQRGWHVLLYDTADDRELELDALGVIGSQVDAVVGYFYEPVEIIEKVVHGMPTVYIGRDRAGATFTSIHIDGGPGIRAAVAHLVADGRHRIGMLDHGGNRPPSSRRRWFLDAMREHGLTGVAVGADQSIDGGARAMASMLEAHPDLDGLLTYNDVIAIGAIRRAVQLGRRVPQDCAVIGFDGLSLGEIVEPQLTSIRIDTRQLGALAIEQVAKLLAGEPAGLATVTPALHVRGSA
ncbi:LacI family DNA-binding transcriptional regulator [Pseudonocardia sp. TRM90224]|uniref:LacI family DNA-binding transcriptional regulator n=1 Tax=Pseudonocardia sp. TRM90224 TaxID=2812678 RepID=UPI001E347B44|nr:LacI family DNA-binding transcriptional regulator [Pseudonocardia sp. TRM90224]